MSSYQPLLASSSVIATKYNVKQWIMHKSFMVGILSCFIISLFTIQLLHIQPTTKFYYHVVPMILAFTFFNLQGISILILPVGLTSMGQSLTRRNKVEIHLMFQLIAFIFYSIGAGVIFKLKNGDHFVTLHGILGATAISIFFSQLLIGAYTSLPWFGFITSNNSIVKLVHTVTSIMSLFLCLASISSGFLKGKYLTDETSNLIYINVGLLTAAVLTFTFGIFLKVYYLYKRRKFLTTPYPAQF